MTARSGQPSPARQRPQ